MNGTMDMIPRALLITLMGMGIVFTVLVLLQFMLHGLRMIFGDKKKEAHAVQNKVEEKPVVVSSTEAVAETASNPAENQELIAVITAAIAACMGSQSNIVVRNIRRVDGNAPVWSKAGRTDVMANRF